MLTVERTARRARARARRPGEAEPTRPIRWVHITELARPDAVAVRRRAAADHRDPARHRGQAAALRQAARRPPPRRARVRHRLRPRHACRRRSSTRPRSTTSRSSRCPTRCRSSRSPRRPSRGSSTSSTRCSQRGIAVHERLERLVLEERGLDELAARAVGRRSAATVAGARRARRGRSPRPRASAASAPQAALDAIGAEVARRNVAGPTGPFAPEHPELGGPRARAAGAPRGRRGCRRPGSSPSATSGGLGDFERLILAAGGDRRGARADAPAGRARHRAAAGRRRARRGARAAGSTPDELASRLRPFGIGEQAAVLVFALDDPAARRGRARAALARGRRPGAGRDDRAGRAAVRGRRRRRASTRSSSPRARATRSPATRRRCARRPAARRRVGVAAAQLPRGALRARGDGAVERPGARGRLLRDLGAFQLLLSVQDDEALRALLRQRARPDRERRGRVRRRAAALAGGVHRAERPVGARRARALLPPPHAALPDPARRGADRARPEPRARPDRVLAGAAGAGAGA